MKIHLVGGFLGSGKTTAIINACRDLHARGERPGVITNDQGRYLVDSAVFHSASVPAAEVGGGCFCCNYGEFHERIAALAKTAAPTHVFAESVGSCADLVATVIKPSDREAEATVDSLSVFADIRLLRLWLEGRRLLFGDNIVYLFSKQLEEADLIVINKSDLLPAGVGQEVLAAATERFPHKRIRLQSSLAAEEIAGWLADIDSDPSGEPDRPTETDSRREPLARPEKRAVGQMERASLDIDYTRYGAAEASLAWYDATVSVSAGDGGATDFVQALLGRLQRTLVAGRNAIGHVKLFAKCGDTTVKLSVTAADQSSAGGEAAADTGLASAAANAAGPAAANAAIIGSSTAAGRAASKEFQSCAGPLDLILNARAEAAPGQLAELVRSAMALTAGEYRRRWKLIHEDAFSPSFPKPTHRVP